MGAEVLVAEIGSTVTKVHAFDGLGTGHPRHLGAGSAPTTVSTGDVTAGLERALADLTARLGRPLAGRPMMAASSASGGLRMTVHGLVRDMTVRAAREAALGAGAIIDLVTAGKVTPQELEEVRRLQPGIIFLAGGVEDGDTEVVLHNARAIASVRPAASVIYAGNTAAREEAAAVLRQAGCRVRIVENVYPRLDRLNIEPARRVIQEVFEDRITEAPGMEKVRERVGGPIRPTPGAVMEAARVLEGLIGDLVVIDVGGATTDVHSVTDGSAELRRILLHPEPWAKRTVEGDLGVYVNAANVVSLVGEDVVAAYVDELSREGRAGEQPGDADPEGRDQVGAPPAPAPRVAASRVGQLLARLTPREPSSTPPEEFLLVQALARISAQVALYRHAGSLRYLFGPTGRVTVAEGKDLTGVKWVVGTGGPLTRFPRGTATLAGLVWPGGGSGPRRPGPGRAPGCVRAAAEPAGAAGAAGDRPLLPGDEALPLVDRSYVLAALGVLHQEYPEAAAHLLREAFPVNGVRV